MEDLLFDEQTIKERFEDFFEIADGFCDAYNEGQAVKLEIDSSLLYLSVVAIYDDIARYKAFHLVNPVRQKSNPVKRAAYAVKWLMHFSPLIFPSMGHKSGKAAPEDGDTLSNAMFAVHFAMMNIREQTGNNFKLTTEMHFELIYDLLYRGLTTDSLIMLFDIISKLSENNDASSIIECT